MKTFDVYSIFDMEITKASGSTLYDHQGRKYLDLYGGHAVISIGHSHPHYVAAITRQLQAIGFYSNSVKISQQEELAEKLGSLSGCVDYNLFLCNSGAEANENALKLASFHTGRKKIIAFRSAFHGRTSLAVAATDNPGISAPVNVTENICFVPLNDLEAFEKAIDDTVAAVIVEGIQGVAGVHEPDAGFLRHVEKLCYQYGALLVLDEVQSGYGRTGKFFAHQWSGVHPHLITVAKGMGNGFPVAGVLIAPGIPARKEMLGTTFGGNYLACAAAIAVLDVIRDEQLIVNAQQMGNYLRTALLSLPGISEVRGRGLMLGIQLPGQGPAVRKQLLDQHAIFTGTSSDKNTIRILPSLAITQEDLNTFVSAFQSTLTTQHDEVFHHR